MNNPALDVRPVSTTFPAKAESKENLPFTVVELLPGVSHESSTSFLPTMSSSVRQQQWWLATGKRPGELVERLFV